MAKKTEIDLSSGFVVKLVNSLFELIPNAKDYDNKPWYTHMISWMIDSKYRVYKRLDKYLKTQLEHPPDDLVILAQTFKGSNDKKIVDILNYVLDNYDYLSDKSNYGKREYFATSVKTFKRKKGDCDDLNSLIYILARLASVPSFLMWNGLCKVKGGGHYCLLYFSPKTDKLYKIDATYYPDRTRIPNRAPFKFSSNAVIDFWYIFNENDCLKN